VPISINSGQAEDADAAVEQILAIRRQLHDLSNVLTGLLITAGLLRSFVPLTGNGGRYASDMEESAERAAALVSEVRTGVHRLQSLAAERLVGAEEDSQSTNVCDVRPSLGQESRED
jgi:signal transduction histidine kinase